MRTQTRWTLLLAALAVTGWLALRAPSDGGPAAAFAPTVAAVDPTQTAVKKARACRPHASASASNQPRRTRSFPHRAPSGPSKKSLRFRFQLCSRHHRRPARRRCLSLLRPRRRPSGAGSVYIARGNDLLTVKAGEVIDGVYRVERITEEEIVFVYLPLDVRQR